ncbi:MAG: hypothetical protein K9H26_06795 [Prolixibacteraceae bacterium]|nr:hypothetical protein [Prolixibacteraceae bacterium]
MKIKTIVLAICVVLFIGCRSVEQSMFNDNFKQLISDTNAVAIEIMKDDTFEKIKSEVCMKKCSNGNRFTGKYALMYSLEERKFINDTNSVYIPFNGFKCLPINRNYAYTILILTEDINGKIALKDGEIISLDEVAGKVKNHFAITLSNYLEPSLVKVVIEDNQKLVSIDSLLFEIVKGYYLFIERISMDMYNSKIVNLKQEELIELKKVQPLELKITSVNGNEYCSF